MMQLVDLRADHLALVREILGRLAPNAEVSVFGSRAKWVARETSDLDLCIREAEPLGFKRIGLLKEAFEESNLPYKVDVLDWATTSENFRKIIERDKVVIQKVGGGMSSEWPSTTLGEICSMQGGAIQTGPFGSQLHTSDYKEIGIPVVMPTNIGDGGIVEEGIARIDQSDVERLSQHKLKLGDIVFSRRGDVTKNALIRLREVGWLCGTGCLKVRLGDEKIASSKFISHCLRHPDIKDWLVRHAVGATMPNLNTGILSAVPINLPPLKTQHEIAEALDSLDDRITLLRETNATLEAIAQALFKSWFVDFDPVRAKQEGRAPEGMSDTTAALFPDSFEESELGLVPKGWRVVRLDSFVELAYGKALKAENRKAGSVPVYGSGGITGWHNQALVDQTSIIVGRKGTVGSLYWESRPFFPIDTVFYVKSRKPLTYCYLLLKTLGLDSMNTDAAVPGLNRENVYRLLVTEPPENILAAFDDIASVLRASMDENDQQAQTLAALRDTLLPRLISGQLRLPEAEALIEEATA
jgi:type I restriction enzyme S subunit